MASEIRTVRPRGGKFEAMQWTGDNEAELIEFTGGRFHALGPEDRGDDPDATGSLLASRNSNWVLVYTDDWIISINGQLSVSKADGYDTEYEDTTDAAPGARWSRPATTKPGPDVQAVRVESTGQVWQRTGPDDWSVGAVSLSWWQLAGVTVNSALTDATGGEIDG